MTEMELRQKIVRTMQGWMGASKGDTMHKDILDTYNAYRPLARGYALVTDDNYCAATVSAAWIKNGCAPYTGTECSCGELIRIAKSRGIWIEADDHRPEIGDALLYAWADSGKGDNTTGHDHIGIVSVSSGDILTVIEGNRTGGKVGTRRIAVNGRYIRGYICPDYKAIAASLSASSWARDAAYWAVHTGVFQGDGAGNLHWQEPVTREQLALILMRFEKRIGGCFPLFF